MIAQLTSIDSAPLTIPELLLSLALGVVLALVTSWHFRRFGSTLANRVEFANVIPFVLLTTILIISVVKTSLALSLGMVGALSIVRFRTPIKEPEELAYLFIALAMGVGLGAQQTWPTVVAGATILGAMTAIKWARRERPGKNLYLSLDLGAGADSGCLPRLDEIVARHAKGCDLRRFDARGEAVEATYLVDLGGTSSLAALTAELRGAFPAIGVTFLDQSRMPVV